MNRLQAAAAGGLTAKRNELAGVLRRIDGMILAIEAGLFEASMKERMQGLERRREVLEAELAAAAEPKPRLHPNLAEVYRQKVAALHEALAAEDGGHEVREALRALVEAVVLVPDDGRLAIEVRGDLAAILALGQAQATRPSRRVAADLLVQVKLVAGARCHLYRTWMSRRISRRNRCPGTSTSRPRISRSTTAPLAAMPANIAGMAIIVVAVGVPLISLVWPLAAS